MAERVFARKLQKVGFEDIAIEGHTPFGLDEAAMFPLFTPAIIGMMRQLIPPQRHDRVAVSVIVRARRPT
jgi:arsenite methyltransferase